MEVTIKGKTYTSRFISLFQLQKCFALAKKYGEAEEKWFEGVDDEAAAKAYDEAWLKYCGAFLVEDVGDLSVLNLTPVEAKMLRDFFHSVVEKATPKSSESDKPSPGSEAS